MPTASHRRKKENSKWHAGLLHKYPIDDNLYNEYAIDRKYDDNSNRFTQIPGGHSARCAQVAWNKRRTEGSGCRLGRSDRIYPCQATEGTSRLRARHRDKRQARERSGLNLVDSSGWLEYFADGKNADFFAPAIENTKLLVVASIN